MENWLNIIRPIASDPIACVALILGAALIADALLLRFPRGSDDAFFEPSDDARHDSRTDRQIQRTAADTLRGLDLRVVAQAVEDMIIDREHLTRILGTGALDLWIDLDLEERHEGPTLRTRAKIAAFEPVPLDEARVAQCARMIKRRVTEELTQLLGVDDAAAFVTGGVTIETAIGRSA